MDHDRMIDRSLLSRGLNSVQNVFDVSVRLKSFPMTFQCFNVLYGPEVRRKREDFKTVPFFKTLDLNAISRDVLSPAMDFMKAPWT